MIAGYTLDLRAEAKREIPILSAPPSDTLRESALSTWKGRMINEYASAAVFEALAEQLERAGVDDDNVVTCRGFASEERRHGILCGAVVEALGGEARAWVPARDGCPEHADAEPIHAVLRNVLSVSCLSETVAVSLIGAERLEMPPGELRDLLTRIYADEIGHARFGWGLVWRLAPTLDDAARAELGVYLAVAFAHLEKHELAHLPTSSSPPPDGAAFGLCSGSDARVLFYETVQELIVPRLEALGLPATAAWKARGRVPRA